MEETPMPVLAELSRTWTREDLQRMLADNYTGNDVDWRRFEIIDGALIVSPSPAPRHEITAGRLIAALSAMRPQGYEVVGALGIDVAPSYLVPDLMVVPSALYFGTASTVSPADALLAVEIVSPSSRTADRVTKPALYAAAGISGYWRVETDPEVTLTAYALDPGATTYTELGTWGPGQTATVERPFPVHVPIDDLVP
jgi:Uma2 family endonuclease